MSEQWLQRAVQSVHEPLILLNSSGAGITGVAYSTPVVQYRCDNSATWTTVTLVAGTLGTYTSGSWVEDSDGQYQLDFPSSIYATASAKEIYVRVSGITGQTPAVMCFTRQLVAVNPQDGQAAGMASLPSSGQLAVTPSANILPGNVTGPYKNIWYVATTGNDSNTGLTPAQAFLTPTKAASVAAPGDLIQIAHGTFSVTATLAPLSGVSIRGAGRTKTFITSTTTTSGMVLLQLANNSEFSDMNVNFTANSTGFPVGVPTTALSNAAIRNMDVVGLNDALYVSSTNTCQIEATDCSFSSTYDTFYIGGASGSSATSRRCTFNVTGPSSGAICRGIVSEAGNTLIAESCKIVITDTTASAEDYGVAAYGGIVNLLSCDIVTTNPNATPYDLYANGGDIVAVGCSFNRQKISGTVTIVGELSDLIDTPNPTAITALAMGFWNILQTAAFVASSMAEWLLSLLGSGSGNGSVTVTVTSTATGTPVVPGATVSLNNSLGQQVAAGQTNGSGQVVLSSDAGTYTLISTLSGQYSPVSQAFTMAVGGANTASVSMTPIAIPQPTFPNQCTVACQWISGGQGVPGAKFTFTTLDAPPGSGTGIGDPPVVAVTNSQGNAYAMLYQNAVYNVQTPSGNSFRYTVPATTTALLTNSI